jgi:RNA polymerase sigma-70 factor, ECF subfamily
MSTQEERWAEAMRAARRGDAAAYRTLLGEISAALRRVVSARLARMGLGTAETEDIVQDELIGIHTQGHSWDETRPFLPWLYAVVHYKVTDAARRLGRDARRQLHVEPEDWETLFAAPEVDLDRATVDIGRHLDALPAGQRAVVHALAVEGVEVRAAARRFNTSEGTIRMTLHRALARIAAAAEAAPDRTRGEGR